MSESKKADVEVLAGKVFTLRWRQRWFWHLEIHPYQQTTVQDAVAVSDAVRRFEDGKKAPLLIHRGFASSPQMDALLHYSKAASELATAVAYWVDSPEAQDSSELIRRWFLRELPVQIFLAEKEAIAWLKQFA